MSKQKKYSSSKDQPQELLNWSDSHYYQLQRPKYMAISGTDDSHRNGYALKYRRTWYAEDFLISIYDYKTKKRENSTFVSTVY